jgi:hypothetical protein
VDDELETIETGTFRQACEREILSLVIRPLRKKYKKKVFIQWPQEERLGRSINYTSAYIFIKAPKPGHIPRADLILDYHCNNLRIRCYHSLPTVSIAFRTKEIPMANPHGHEEAIEYISEILDQKLNKI